MVTTEALQMFDGVMLSDGTITNLVFGIVQHGHEHMDWLQLIRSALISLGTPAAPPDLHTRVASLPRGPTRQPFSNQYEYSVLRSRRSLFIHQQRERWYPERTKRIPEDLVLTPLCLANLYMGDGSSARCRNSRKTVQTCFYTQSYNLQSIELLESGFRTLSIATGRSHDKKCSTGGVILTILQESVDNFMTIVEPFITSSFKYKLKWKGGSDSGNTTR